MTPEQLDELHVTGGAAEGALPSHRNSLNLSSSPLPPPEGSAGASTEFFNIRLPKAVNKDGSGELGARADQQLRDAATKASFLAGGNSGRAIMQRQTSLRGEPRTSLFISY
jgi:hypothetical protein